MPNLTNLFLLVILMNYSRDLSDKDREMIARIDEARCEVATMWEDRLLCVLNRTKQMTSFSGEQ